MKGPSIGIDFVVTPRNDIAVLYSFVPVPETRIYLLKRFVVSLIHPPSKIDPQGRRCGVAFWSARGG